MTRKIHVNSQKPHAIVIGLDNMNGIQTARILARHQIPVIAIANDAKHFCCRTKVCERILITDTASEALIGTLLKLGPTLDQKAVLFPCIDMCVLLISRYRKKLEQWYHLVLPSAEVVEMMMNKIDFYAYAQNNEFSIPRTRFLKSKTDVEKAANELSFPCVLKPPISASPEWEQHSKLKAYKVSCKRELLAVYNQSRKLTKDLILQEWITGPSSNLYSCNCYFNSSSEPVVTFVARKLRSWPPITGESCIGEEIREDFVLNETLRLFKTVNYHGLGYVEMKRDAKSGKYYIIEPNIGRPTGRSSIAEASGVEMIYTMYCDSVGWTLPPNRMQKYRKVKWIYLRRDCQSALYHWQRGDLKFKEWWRSVRGQKAYALFSWTDFRPFLGDLQRAIRLYFIPKERKKRNYRNLFPL